MSRNWPAAHTWNSPRWMRITGTGLATAAVASQPASTPGATAAPGVDGAGDGVPVIFICPDEAGNLPGCED